MDRVFFFLFRIESKFEMFCEKVCMLFFLLMFRIVFVIFVMCVFFFLKCLKYVDYIVLIIEFLGKVFRKFIVVGKYFKEFFIKKGKINFLLKRFVLDIKRVKGLKMKR